MYEASILIATHRRNHVLQWNLESLTKQLCNIEVIVLDDCYLPDIECKNLVESFSGRLNIRYVHSGKTKNGKDIWRVPGYAYNIGARLSSGNVLVVGCGEMYQYGQTVRFIVDTISKDKKQMCTLNGIDDRTGYFLNKLNDGKEINLQDCLSNKHYGLLVALPFFMGIAREEYFAIGGYDESFVGMAYEDNDFVDRLVRNGVKQSHCLVPLPVGYKSLIPVPNDMFIIHLNTPHVSAKAPGNAERHEINRSLYERNKRDAIVVVNRNIEWGKL